jgi:hypothetical protein
MPDVAVHGAEPVHYHAGIGVRAVHRGDENDVALVTLDIP